MRVMLWLVASLLAASFTTAAASQEIDWQKVDDGGKSPVAEVSTI